MSLYIQGAPGIWEQIIKKNKHSKMNPKILKNKNHSIFLKIIVQKFNLENSKVIE